MRTVVLLAIKILSQHLHFVKEYIIQHRYLK